MFIIDWDCSHNSFFKSKKLSIDSSDSIFGGMGFQVLEKDVVVINTNFLHVSFA
jgi:hypothetical protein